MRLKMMQKTFRNIYFLEIDLLERQIYRENGMQKKLPCWFIVQIAIMVGDKPFWSQKHLLGSKHLGHPLKRSLASGRALNGGSEGARTLTNAYMEFWFLQGKALTTESSCRPCTNCFAKPQINQKVICMLYYHQYVA